MIKLGAVKENDRLVFCVDDFDGSCRVQGVITKVFADHALMRGEDGYTYWLDADNADMYERRVIDDRYQRDRH